MALLHSSIRDVLHEHPLGNAPIFPLSGTLYSNQYRKAQAERILTEIYPTAGTPDESDEALLRFYCSTLMNHAVSCVFMCGGPVEAAYGLLHDTEKALLPWDAFPMAAMLVSMQYL